MHNLMVNISKYIANVILNRLFHGDRMLCALTLVTLLYLFWQMSLSGAILTAASVEDSRRLSDLARLTVGFGAGLLTVRIGYAKALRPLFIAVLALTLGYGATWLEDTIVNTLADNTNAEGRRDAAAVLLFNRGLIDRKAELDNLPASIATDRVQLMAFAKVLGFVVWNNPQMMAQVHGVNQRIFDALTLPTLFKKNESAYADYVKAFNANIEKASEMLKKIERANYAGLADLLRGQLTGYARCITPECRGRYQRRVDAYIKQINMPLDVNLDDFCRTVSTPAYALGKPVGSQEKRTCTTDEKDLYNYAQQRAGQQISKEIAKATGETPSAEELQQILTLKPMSREDWQRKAEPRIQEALEKLRAETFFPAEQYAPGAPHAAEGREHSIAVFLPPVALGFSVVVCLLHITSMAIVLVGRARLCMGLGFMALLLPLFIATPVPLEGFAGLYGRWLIFWEAAFYPWSIFRTLLV